MRITIGIIIGIILCIPIATDAQITIKGKVSDSTLQSLPSATVYYTALNKPTVLGFTRSDADGNYVLRVRPEVGDSLLVHFNFVGYKDKVVRVATVSNEINCTMTPSAATLPNIIVKNSPIHKYGDSIGYNVGTFTDKTDRSIGDVLKKMPGIGVGEDGRVYYQGKAIQKLSINGLNLMEGRYGVITTNLPAVSVNTVQVIDHDQPIRILDSLVPSKGASINLKLKKISTTGNGEIGMGLFPFLRDVNLSHMVFLKNFQTINTVASNNIGKDQTILFKDFQTAGVYNNQVVRLTPLTSAGALPGPSLDKTYWLNNNINLASSNSIWKTAKDWEFKIGLGYYSDRQEQEGNTQTKILTKDQLINIQESRHYETRVKDFSSNIIVEKNTKKLFFRNNLSLRNGERADSGTVDNNEKKHIIQIGHFKTFSIANKMSIIMPVGKQLLSLNSQFSYGALPEFLSVYPGTFKTLLKDTGVFRLGQNVRGVSIGSDNSVELTKRLGNLTLSPKVGYAIRYSSIGSSVNSFVPDSVPSTGLLFLNQARYWKNELYATLKSNYKFKNWEFLLNTPISLMEIRLKNTGNDRFQRLPFLPSFYATYHFSTDLTAYVSANRNLELPDINNFFGNYIVTNYRQVQKNGIGLASVQQYNTYSGGFEYNNTPEFLFLNGSVSMNNGKKNYIDSMQISSDGAAVLNTFMTDNTFRSTSLSFEGSKFLLAIKTVLKLSNSINASQEEQFVNGNLARFKTTSFLLKAFATTTFSKSLSAEWNASFNHVRTASSNLSKETYLQYKQHIGLSIIPFEAQLINIGMDCYSTSGSLKEIRSLVNAYYKISFTKRKTELYLYCSNIFNVGYYNSFFNSANVIVQNNYALRPRQAGISYKFYFK